MIIFLLYSEICINYVSIIAIIIKNPSLAYIFHVVFSIVNK